MGLARFSVEMHMGRAPKVRVNDECVRAGPAVMLDHEQSAVPRLALELAGEGTIEGEGIVEVVRESNEVDYLRAFLANLDPTQMERAALEQLHQGAETNGQAFLAALREMVG